jgi:Spy/CpxP family protein refolding chaperone
VSYLTTLLSLNAAQQQQALAIFKNEATAESSMHEQMKNAHDALDIAVKSNDATGIDQAAASIGSLTAQSVSRHAKAQSAFLQTLSAEQQTKLAALESQRPHGGPGGPGGPPMNGMFGGPPPGR